MISDPDPSIVPPRNPNRLIFLDVDGVLNQHDWDPVAHTNPIHRDKVIILNRILREIGAGIVLSSAWRYIIHRNESKLEGLDYLFRSHGLMYGRLVGITRTDTLQDHPYSGDLASWPVSNERGRQITEWLDWQNQLYGSWQGEYLAIDDMDLGITEAGIPLVKVDGKVGLTEADADRAINLMGCQ
jgi:hypothetical protein